MIDAARLVQSVREDLRKIDDYIREHPYPDALMRGEVSAEALRAFPGHQYHIITSDLRSLALLVQRFGDAPSRDFLMGILDGERQGLDGLLAMAGKLGMSEEDLKDYEVSAEGFAYTTFMAWQALYASAAEFVIGILVNFAAWGHNCGRMSAALQQSYGFTDEETAFLDAFANMPPFEEVALAIIQDGLDRGEQPARLRRSARLFQAYELMFWDAMAAAAKAA
ncbi:MAG: transcriptional regulator [Gemmatimonadota bacterium]|nr:MAG: transcriptional regulator [Gemmatimonadota bacterium]